MELLQLIGSLLWLVILVFITVGMLLQLIVHAIVELLLLIVRSVWKKVMVKKGRTTQPEHADALP